MITVLIVTDDDLTENEVARFKDVKERVLGYGEGEIHSPTPQSTHLDRTPLGAVKIEDDAERLIAALRHEFENRKFVIERRDYPSATRIEFYSIRGNHP